MKHRIFSGLLTLIATGALFLFLPSPTAAAEEWNIYLGQLHSHSGALDGIGPAEAVFSAAKASDMDFFALTDYSHSFENSNNGCISSDGSDISPTWKSGKEAARAASDDRFTAIYGYEMAWRRDLRLGHIVTFATPGWQCRGQAGFQKPQDYYNALTQVETSIGMFCHPGDFYGDFQNFSHLRWDYDDHMALLEVSGENGQTFWGAYQTALDVGWHVAPAASGASHTGDWGASRVRTGILAENATESSLYAAIRARRVYATLDPDLEIHYSLDGHIMGSRVTDLKNREVTFSLSESTGIVQIVSSDGEVVASCDASETSLAVPAGKPYYYLRVVREGEIIAVTAPVWVENLTDFGCRDITASASVPVQQEPISLSFTLYNHEKADLVLNSIQLLVDGTVVWESSDTVVPGHEKTLTVSYTHAGVGITGFSLVATGTIGEKCVTIQKELTLSYRPKVLNAHILVDGTHSGVSSGDLDNLIALAEKADMDVGIFHDEMPEGGKVLIVPPPEQNFSDNYPQLLKNFVEKGGQLILCGAAGNNDRMNCLLGELGSSMSLNNDTARDPVHNGGTPESLYPDTFHPNHWDFLTGNEYYSHQSGCTVNPGNGIWLVKGKETMVGESPVLLAKEDIGDGTLFLAGSFFLNDDHMPLPENEWDTPRGNLLLMESILGVQRNRLPITDIKSVRSGDVGEVFRVKGYITAGTSDPYNTFPGLIYLQDDTGGIEITHFEIPDMEVGFRLDITGQLHMDGENPALKLISCERISDDLYRFAPDRLFHAASMNYSRHGGELMKVEGIAQDIEYTEDGLGVRRFTLMDPLGVPAEILVEDCIRSGSSGENRLASEVLEGKNTRAYGILHLEENGNPVLRVRNCDEVVNIPPMPEWPEPKRKESTNPKTGDVFFTFEHICSKMFQKE